MSLFDVGALGFAVIFVFAGVFVVVGLVRIYFDQKNMRK